jgi:hypothetical protein
VHFFVALKKKALNNKLLDHILNKYENAINRVGLSGLIDTFKYNLSCPKLGLLSSKIFQPGCPGIIIRTLFALNAFFSAN